MFVCVRERAYLCLRVYVCEKEKIFVCLRVREGVEERGLCVCVNESVRAGICVVGWVSKRERVYVCDREDLCVCVYVIV